jgi:hypothetical protein
LRVCRTGFFCGLTPQWTAISMPRPSKNDR